MDFKLTFFFWGGFFGVIHVLQAFAEEAGAAIEDVLARGNTPIVVGGTAFYLRTLIYGRTGER